MRPSTIIITSGDPCGIGPEVVLKALARRRPRSAERLAVIGDLRVFSDAAKRMGRALPRWKIRPAGAARLEAPLTFVDCGHRGPFHPGRPSRAAGRAALGYLREAVRLWRAGQLDALVTAPVTKWAIARELPSFVGHTEFLCRATGTKEALMMFASERLRVALLTRHVPIRALPRAVTAAGLRRALETLHRTLRDHFGVPRPRLAVCGLNPHAGESAPESEESRVMRPALRALRRRGIACEGPLAADGLFGGGRRYDAVLCMYHDQGLIPFKMAARDSGCQLTAGLPFIRTSPDHGSALDIAGSGNAHPGSMMYALDLAARLAAHADRC
jgi:4-hydroxythreonine-4-phosphate dehydrogenase